jgi:hypothetical protein
MRIIIDESQVPQQTTVEIREKVNGALARYFDERSSS